MKIKKITKSVFFQKILGFIIYIYIVLCYKTSKWSVVDFNKQKHNHSTIYCFWHGRLAMAAYSYYKKSGMNVLISPHSDGEIIKNTMSHFNFATISGSSKKNSVLSLKHIIKKLNNNENVAITPDGPKGPAHKINSNIIEISRITKAPIMPIAFSMSRNIILNSWDSFMLPFPFSKGVLIYGELITVPTASTITEREDLKAKLALKLTEITLIADDMVNNKKSRTGNK